MNRRVEDFSDLFTAPRWLRDLGATAWLLVGVTLFVVAVVWFLALTQTIVMPVVAAGVVAAVAAPVVAWLQRRGLPRAIAALVLFLGLVLVGAGVVYIVVAGVTGEFDELRHQLASAKDTLAGWLTDLGVDQSTADSAKDDASSSASSIVPALLQGLLGGLKELSGLVFFLALTALSLFFLLSDGPRIRAWAEGHMRVSRDMAHAMTGRVLESLRGYFLGVTIVAAFNALVVGGGALLLGVPVAGTIAIVTFLGAYIPYLGAWTAGAFSVLIALGGAGTDAALGMIVLQLLANGILQQMVQPFAMGAALGIHPLAVLVVTIAGGALFGAAGLILAAPLTSAATRIAADLSARPAAPT
ncbi:MAG: AI-2E family transporter [Thermoleophilaceae bacterium]|nr:AI-2E family transporter [Thermoleophilaceae bacterium]